jgi:hypothetical protein
MNMENQSEHLNNRKRHIQREIKNHLHPMMEKAIHHALKYTRRLFNSLKLTLENILELNIN